MNIKEGWIGIDRSLMAAIDRLLMDALETFPNFVLVDDKSHIVYINNRYAALLGTTSESAIGKHVNTVIPNTRMDVIVRTGKEEIGSPMTLFDHTKNEEVTVVCNRIPIWDGDKVVGAVAATTLNSIFDVKKLHEEIEEIKKQNCIYKKRLDELASNHNPLERVIGTSKAVVKVKKTIAEYADSNLSFLITGETGVGKEVFARAVHQMSNRVYNNYVRINCAAIPHNLLESELFGYTEGAFTGALKGGKIGKFELADKGTLLLDEIGEMPLELQAKLLRVLQDREIERVGGVRPIKINVRIICSTNKDIEQMVREGKFREDLYYRINIIEMNIPPLRERKEDIPPLCMHFLERINGESGYDVTGISSDVAHVFQSHYWPGNVRELEHTLERAAVKCKKGLLELDHIDFLHERMNKRQNDAAEHDAGLKNQTQRTERDAIVQAIQQAGGNKTKAAQILQIDRSRLYSKIKKYNITI